MNELWNITQGEGVLAVCILMLAGIVLAAICLGFYRGIKNIWR